MYSVINKKRGRVYLLDQRSCKDSEKFSAVSLGKFKTVLVLQSLSLVAMKQFDESVSYFVSQQTKLRNHVKIRKVLDIVMMLIYEISILSTGILDVVSTLVNFRGSREQMFIVNICVFTNALFLCLLTISGKRTRHTHTI